MLSVVLCVLIVSRTAQTCSSSSKSPVVQPVTDSSALCPEPSSVAVSQQASRYFRRGRHGSMVLG